MIHKTFQRVREGMRYLSQKIKGDPNPGCRHLIGVSGPSTSWTTDNGLSIKSSPVECAYCHVQYGEQVFIENKALGRTVVVVVSDVPGIFQIEDSIKVYYGESIISIDLSDLGWGRIPLIKTIDDRWTWYSVTPFKNGYYKAVLMDKDGQKKETVFNKFGIPINRDWNLVSVEVKS